jgi:type I site-specific restriction endonuclease
MAELNKEIIDNIKDKLNKMDKDEIENINENLKDINLLKGSLKDLSQESINEKLELLEQWEEKLNKKQINLKLTETQIKDLEKLSNKMGGVNKSNLIRIAITEYIMKYKELLVE